MEKIEDPVNEIEAVRAWLKDKSGFQAYCGDFVYATIPNCTEESQAEAEGQGWVMVQAFKGYDYEPVDTLPGKPNAVLFRRNAPEFYSYDNPWTEKGPLGWLPNLEARVPPKLRPLMELSSPHGGPCLVRRYRCTCGEKKLRIQASPEAGRVEAVCAECGDRKILMDSEALKSKHEDTPKPPAPIPPESLTSLKCECNTKPLSPLLAIEYAPDSDDGWDFAWMKVVALCRNCGRSWFVAETEL